MDRSEGMPKVFKAAIKAIGGYFEESTVFWIINSFDLPYGLILRVDAFNDNPQSK